MVDAVCAATVDRPVAWPDEPAVGLLETLLARRLDDLAYGSGLWIGAVRHRSVGALTVKVLIRRVAGNRDAHSASSPWRAPVVSGLRKMLAPRLR